MKLKELKVTIRETLNVGNYENITPEVMIVGDLDEGDDPVACSEKLHKIAQAAWARQALMELSWVAVRRKSDTSKLHEYMQLTKDTRAQLKSLILM